MHTKSLQTLGIPVTAVCDKDAAKAQKAAQELDAQAFTCYKEMLRAGGFEVLHICLPHFLHAQAAICALETGVHVLCEKPMATTLEDATRMAKAAQKSGKALGIVFQNRYNTGVLLIKNALDSGALGAITGGYFRVTWHRKASYYTNSDWRGRWATEGGGAVINQAIHIFDLFNYFFGAFHHVKAAIANRAHPEIEVEDVADGIIFYGEKGDIPISFFVNTYHPHDAPITLEIIGEKGHAKLTGEDAEIHFNDGTIQTAGADIDAQRKYEMKSYWGVSHIKQITAFYKALETGEARGFTDKTALDTQRLVNEIYGRGALTQ